MGRAGKVVFKRGSGGSWGRGVPARRGGDATDEEYVVGEEEEESSDDSYSSDASREASQDAEGGSCSEEEEEGDDEQDEYDLWDEEDVEASARRRPRKGLSDPRRKHAAKPLHGKRSSVMDEEGEMEDFPIGKPRARRLRRPEILADGEEDENDDDDKDFAPDEDEDDEEELTRAPTRKPRGRRSRPVKRQRRGATPRKPQVTEKKREKALVRKRMRRITPGSDDDDFIVEDRVLVDGVERNKRGSSSGRKRRRSLSSSPDPSDSDASDVDYTISEEELRDLPVSRASDHQELVDLWSGGVQGRDKRKGKEIGDVGKQVCGICLSEEHNMVVRGLLDCCAHYFCFACIMEWSKVESRCPVCKRRFKTVCRSTRSDAGFGLRTAIIRIPKRDQVYQPSEEEIRGYLDPYANVVCMVCQQGGDDNLMLLCDICDSSAHTYCVGLGREVPEGNWYCDGCRYTEPDSSNSRVQEYALEHGTSNSDMLQEELSGGVDSENVMGCMSLIIPQQSSSLPCQLPSSQGTGRGTSIRCQTFERDYETTSHVSGFAASTVSGRRSIHQRIRIILSNNRVRWIPGVARNNVIQPSSLESCHCDSETQQNGDLHPVSQEKLTNGVNERNITSSPGPRVGMNPCIPSEGNSCCLGEGAKKQVKSAVKRHLNHLTRDTSLGRRDLKEIARHATHTILAACGFQYRQSMVTTTTVQVPSNCVHLADGDLASLVKGCCSSCFTSFVEDVVQEILDFKLRSA